jgi:hypothetical protein
MFIARFGVGSRRTMSETRYLGWPNRAAVLLPYPQGTDKERSAPRWYVPWIAGRLSG